jgi:hypothetical protein
MTWFTFLDMMKERGLKRRQILFHDRSRTDQPYLYSDERREHIERDK